MKNKKALLITKEAKGNAFVDCKIEGAQIDGKETRMVRTEIYNFRKEHPNLWAGTLLSLFLGIILLFIEYNIFIK